MARLLGATLAHLAVALALLLSCARAALSPPCQGVTGIAGCIECTADPRKCWLCNELRNPVWSSDGKITQCKLATKGQTCIQASGDPNCVRCDGIWCVACKKNYFFNADFKCVTAGTAAARCAGLSKNDDCAVCNPDGTCKKCKASTPKHLVMPLSTIYINVPGGQSKCVTQAYLANQAQAIGGKALSIPAGCLEVTPDFACARCVDGNSLTNGGCYGYLTAKGSGCKASVPYREYCAKCNAAGTACIECTHGRSLINGACSVNCKTKWGIGCLRCNNAECLGVDPAYANGRR